MQMIMYLILATCLSDEEVIVAYSSLLLQLIASQVEKSLYALFSATWIVLFL
jgi:hypothetical protein